MRPVLSTLWYWIGLVLLLILMERFTFPIFGWERSALIFASRLRGVWLDRLFSFITWAGSLYLLVPFAVIASWWLLEQERTADAWLLGLGLGGASLITHLAKLWFARPRPDLFPSIGQLPTDASFPSAHTAQIVACVAAALLFRPSVGGIDHPWVAAGFAMLAVMVALSRIYLQVHYPSDVLAGALVALFWVFGLDQLLQALDGRSR